jgi:transcriptional/translational regulatory protein YebC/TACO1
VSKDKADTLFKLLNILEDNDDVQAVSSNFDVSDDVLVSLTT